MGRSRWSSPPPLGAHSVSSCPSPSPSLPTNIVGSLLQTPHRVGRQLRPPLDDRHSARRGTYRVLYRIDDADHRVTVVGVFGRADDYRSL
jgi:mRNA-degrading endonuclease RelE of RelBE toxin-antitoxin system